MNAKASKPAPHVALILLGPADSLMTGVNLFSFNLCLTPSRSTSANFIATLSKVIAIPLKGLIIVSKDGLTLVGNTRKTEIRLRIATTTTLSSLDRSRRIRRRGKGMIVGNPHESRRTMIFDVILDPRTSGVPPRERITNLRTSFKYINVN